MTALNFILERIFEGARLGQFAGACAKMGLPILEVFLFRSVAVIFILHSMLLLSACQYEGGSSSISAQQNLAKAQEGVIGGQIVTPDMKEALATVALVVDIEGHPRSFCSGVLISRDLVLTAAHCLAEMEDIEFKVFIGTQLPRRYSSKELLEVKDSRIHPSYRDILDSEDEFLTAWDDVAVVQLSQSVSDSFQPAEIVQGMESGARLVGAVVTVAGFGIVDDQNQKSLRRLSSADIRISGLSDERLLLVDQSRSIGGCAGDSGGPLFLKESSADRQLVVGIVRGPHQKALHCHGTGEYTTLGRYEDFITESAQTLGADLPVFSALGAAF